MFLFSIKSKANLVFVIPIEHSKHTCKALHAMCTYLYNVTLVFFLRQEHWIFLQMGPYFFYHLFLIKKSLVEVDQFNSFDGPIQ